MRQSVNVLVIGGGQSGLAMSHLLTQEDVDHVVLERGQAANAWRHERWDSLHLVIPNRYWRMPGLSYEGDRPDSFMSKSEVVACFERYVARAKPPLLTETHVQRVTQDGDGKFLVDTRGRQFACRQLVVATGPFQVPNTPPWAADIDPAVVQVASMHYRNPSQIPDGGVLVVGTGQSGAQIAEELLRAGRKVFICVGPRGWIPRRYLGRDITDWYHDMAVFDVTLAQFPSIKEARAGGFSQVAGDAGRGHDANIHTLHASGATLLGRLAGGGRDRLHLHDGTACIEAADAVARKARAGIDAYVAAHALTPGASDPWPVYQGTRLDPRATLDFRRDGVRSIVWANGFRPAYSWLALPALDDSGSPIHLRGVSPVEGLYFLGLEWQHRRKSSTLMAGDEDARHLLDHMLAMDRAIDKERLRAPSR